MAKRATALMRLRVRTDFRKWFPRAVCRGISAGR